MSFDSIKAEAEQHGLSSDGIRAVVIARLIGLEEAAMDRELAVTQHQIALALERPLKPTPIEIAAAKEEKERLDEELELLWKKAVKHRLTTKTGVQNMRAGVKQGHFTHKEQIALWKDRCEKRSLFFGNKRSHQNDHLKRVRKF